MLALVESGALELSTPVRSVLGDDLPLVDDAVTVEHLLTHRSGIGEYLDDDGRVDTYVMPVPVHELATTMDFIAVLDGHPTAFPAGERFAYCNAGFVVLALVAERVGGAPFHDLVDRHVIGPAAMPDTAFLRSDELPGRTAVGYLADGPRSNVFHLPVRGSGDGGAYSTTSDIRGFWEALFDGRLLPPERVADTVRARSDVPGAKMRYGLGIWLHARPGVVVLEGSDAGVSFRSVHDPAAGTTHTVVSNTSDGAWPLARALDRLVTPIA